jgi:hypothetical protein
MKIILIAGSLILGALALSIVEEYRRPHVVRAQAGCTALSLNGPYGYAVSGSGYDGAGNLVGFLAGTGRIVFDGNGTITTGADTFSYNGTIVRRTYTGNYNIMQDCTGSMVLQASGGVAHGDIVLVNNGKEVNFVQTDNNFVFSGVFKSQFPTP